MSYGLNLGGGGTCRGLHRVFGGLIQGYTTNLVQGSYYTAIMEKKLEHIIWSLPFRGTSMFIMEKQRDTSKYYLGCTVSGYDL